MNFESIGPYLLPAGFAAWLLLRHFRYRAARRNMPKLEAEGAVFVDVRTPGEFAAGNRPGSLNIPLDAIAQKAGTLDKDRPVVLSCASGARSGIAAGILRSMGFKNVTNAGPWQNTL